MNPGTSKPVAERFWSHVDKGDGCWEWTAARHRAGYGAFGLDRAHMTYAHRYSWELHFGAIPEGLFVCHTCDNPPCVRPDHLFLGTIADNTADMMAKGRRVQGRTYVGEANHNAKLTEAQVREIRSLFGTLPSATLGARYGVSGGLIRQIGRREAWRHVV